MCFRVALQQQSTQPQSTPTTPSNIIVDSEYLQLKDKRELKDISAVTLFVVIRFRNPPESSHLDT